MRSIVSSTALEVKLRLAISGRLLTKVVAVTVDSEDKKELANMLLLTANPAKAIPPFRKKSLREVIVEDIIY
jgi:hypothetical protein